MGIELREQLSDGGFDGIESRTVAGCSGRKLQMTNKIRLLHIDYIVQRPDSDRSEVEIVFILFISQSQRQLKITIFENHFQRVRHVSTSTLTVHCLCSYATY